MNELETLVDFSEASTLVASIDATYFPNTPAFPFWTISSADYGYINIWFVNFGGGGAGYEVGSEYSWYARCVR